MMWEIVGYSEKWLRISSHPDNIIIDEYERGEGVHGARFKCYVECDDEIQAEMVAIDTFDSFLKGLILASGIAYDITMDRPKQITSTIDDKTRVLKYDPQRTYSNSFLVEPFRAYALPPFSTDKLYEWVDIIHQHKENPLFQRLIALYCRAVRLAKISKSAGYLDFIKIIEFFVEKKYRKELESKIAQQATTSQMNSFSVEFGKLLNRYFPGISEAKKEKITKDVALKCFSQAPYSNKELLDYVCKESGFYEKTLSGRKVGLEGIINSVYNYWPEEKRKEHLNELFKEHEKHILGVSKTLFKVRASQAHISEKIEADRGPLAMCSSIAHYLLSELIRGKIVLNGKAVSSVPRRSEKKQYARAELSLSAS